MTAIHETAYPRIRLNMTENELAKIYTPDEDDIAFAKSHTYVSIARLELLVLLKAFQRLGYFPKLKKIPPRIINHIASYVGLQRVSQKLIKEGSGGSRWRHIPLIRSYLGISAYSDGGEKIMIDAMTEASQTKNVIADIINASIEELVRRKYELPSFGTMLRAAKETRHKANNIIYNQIYKSLNKKQKKLISSILKSPSEGKTLWFRLKQEPKQPTTKNMREFVEHMLWLQSLNKYNADFDGIPEIKIKNFADEARSLDINHMNELRIKKGYALTSTLILEQAAKVTNDFTDMYCKRVRSLHNRGRDALSEYRTRHQDKTDDLVHTLEEIVTAWESENSDADRIKALKSIISNDADDLLRECRAHMVFAENNYLPFLPKLYKSQRKNFFEFIEIVRPKSSSTDKSLENAVEFMLANRHKRTDKIKIVKNIKQGGKKREKHLVNLSWVPDKWWKMVTDNSTKKKKIREVNRIFFEICLFSMVMQELNSGDLYIKYSSQYGDYSKQFVSWSEFQELIIPFLQQIGLPTNINQIAAELKSTLTQSAISTDKAFPSNEAVSVKNGELVLRKIPKTKDPEGFDLINRMLTERTPNLNLIDILSDTEHWINWTSSFRPISGYETRIESSQEKYIKTTYCYGCYMGPSQTERSFDGINRKQLAYLNRRHIDEEKLQKAIVKTINEYNQFKLPKVWGHGKSASADGTKWDMYQRNLLSEYHIRYGGWGGIGYYHVSDKYIALFSHFIPCGVYEAVYILDGLFKNTSEIQPDTLHADTHGQSAVVFGLAYLLRIKLMPRIKNWKNLKFFLPEKNMKLKNIEMLFTDTIDWRLIEKYMPDMLRVALSISKGKLAPSTILRKLGTQSRKNKLYFAFRELGRVVRTIYLLEYLSNEELRKTVRAATINSEEWNSFINWIAFGGNGVIAENVRDEQRKIIKYNHLVANLTILHNVQTMTKIFNDLKDEGYVITEEIAGHFAPYRNGHINRFGKIDLKFDHIPEPLTPNVDFSVINNS